MKPMNLFSHIHQHFLMIFAFGLSLIALSIQVHGQQMVWPSSTGADIIAPNTKTLEIEAGKGTLIRLDRPATSVFIANPDIADVQVKSQRVVYVFGKTQGTTSFYALDSDDTVIFSADVKISRNLASLQSALKQMLPDAYIRVSIVGDMLLLDGSVASPDEAHLAEQLAISVIGAGKVMNRLSISQPTQVSLRVKIAEVNRSITKQFGFNWESFLNGSSFSMGLQQGRNVADILIDPITQLPTRVFGTSTTASSLFGNITRGDLDMNFAIDALDREGFLTVLAEPNLTALTGQSASFLAGGEFPIPIPSEDGNIAIEYREFGVKLAFTPTVLSTGRISVHVQPEVSELSSAGAIKVSNIEIPSLSTRRAETTVELGSGQSFVIAGLLQNSVTQDADKFPGLGDIPILGALFRSESFRRNETELLIVVTPYAVRPVSDRQLALPTDGFIAPSDMQRFLGGKRWQATQPKSPQAKDKKPGPSLKKRAGFQIK